MNRAERRRQKKKGMATAAALNKSVASGGHDNRLAGLLHQAVQLHQTGNYPAAKDAYQQVLSIDPNQPDALNLLGVLARRDGNAASAVDLISASIRIRPDFADAHSNLGNALMDLGQLERACASYRKALDIHPEHADAHHNLGNALAEQGRADQAFEHHQRAVGLNPEKLSFWAGFGRSLESVVFHAADESLWRDLTELLERRVVRPARIVPPILNALRHHPDFSRALERANDPDDIATTCHGIVRQLSQIPLFLKTLEQCPINDLDVERLLTALRRNLLLARDPENPDGDALPFLAALALQCFTNEYVYPETSEETDAVSRLDRELSECARNGQKTEAYMLALLGAYRPLHTYPWARALNGNMVDSDLRDVFIRHITEPAREAELRAKIPCLTPVQDSVSILVQEQYEENPYPRWISTGLETQSRSIGAVLTSAPLSFDLEGYASPERPDVLVAGCGTGQISLFVASRFSNVRVLAVDLSLSSLSYAMRKSSELHCGDVEYAQADIMEIDRLDREFDLIDCSGVLHHLDDPLKGWRALTSVLRTGGVMKIGLYSEAARRHIVAARALVAERGYRSTPEDIRRCREDIIAMANDGDVMAQDICRSRDFFSMSNCRDLIFHVQEHRFSLPQIKDALQELGLTFLGFELHNRNSTREFKDANPSRESLTSLDLWHEFEEEHPDTFQGMYQFWCRKSG